MFGLDPAPRYRLQRPPRAQAFGQVQFSARAKLATLEGVAPVQDLLHPVFPYMRPQQVQQVSLLVGPAGASAAGSQSQQMWQFDDGAGWSLGLSADTATLSVGPQYRDFSEFSERFRSILTALADGAGVTRADRLGVRYVNIAEVPPGDADAWRQWFRPELTGWGATETVGDGTRLLTSITQSQLAAPAAGELRAGQPERSKQSSVMASFPPTRWSQESFRPSRRVRPTFSISISLWKHPNHSRLRSFLGN